MGKTKVDSTRKSWKEWGGNKEGARMGKSRRLECDNCHCAPAAEVLPSSAAVIRSKQVDHLFAKCVRIKKNNMLCNEMRTNPGPD